jgi:hypothetical protein
MTHNPNIRFALVAALCGLMLATPAFAQRAADRASTRTDTTRAATEGRINRLEQGEQTIVREEVITVTRPVKKKTAVGAVGTEGRAGRAAGSTAEGPKTTTERITVRRVETIKRAPRINPY